MGVERVEREMGVERGKGGSILCGKEGNTIGIKCD